MAIDPVYPYDWWIENILVLATALPQLLHIAGSGLLALTRLLQPLGIRSKYV